MEFAQQFHDSGKPEHGNARAHSIGMTPGVFVLSVVRITSSRITSSGRAPNKNPWILLSSAP
jgi:hypothetical protein